MKPMTVVWVFLAACIAYLLVAQPSEADDYTRIGNLIDRTLDLELGVACYNRASGQFSCVNLKELDQ